MSGEAWLYLFAVLINAVNLFLQVFFTIMYSDLEWYVSALSTMNRRRGGGDSVDSVALFPGLPGSPYLSSPALLLVPS